MKNEGALVRLTQNPMVKDSPRDLLIDKIVELNQVAEKEEGQALIKRLEQRRQDCLLKHDKYLKKLSAKWLGVKEGTFDKLTREEKNMLSDQVLSRAKRVTKFLRSAAAFSWLPYLYSVFYLIPYSFTISPDLGPGLFVVTILGCLIPVVIRAKVIGSSFIQFIKYRKICFPEPRLIEMEKTDGK